MLSETHFTLTHVLEAMLVALFLIFGAFAYKGAVSRGDAVVPPKKFNLRNLFEMFTDGVLSTMEGVMGKKNAVKYLPFIGSLAFFIFFCNALALLPGFAPPTDPSKPTSRSRSVFCHALLRREEHGMKYFSTSWDPSLAGAAHVAHRLISHIAVHSLPAAQGKHGLRPQGVVTFTALGARRAHPLFVSALSSARADAGVLPLTWCTSLWGGS